MVSSPERTATPMPFPTTHRPMPRRPTYAPNIGSPLKAVETQVIDDIVQRTHRLSMRFEGLLAAKRDYARGGVRRPPTPGPNAQHGGAEQGSRNSNVASSYRLQDPSLDVAQDPKPRRRGWRPSGWVPGSAPVPAPERTPRYTAPARMQRFIPPPTQNVEENDRIDSHQSVNASTGLHAISTDEEPHFKLSKPPIKRPRLTADTFAPPQSADSETLFTLESATRLEVSSFAQHELEFSQEYEEFEDADYQTCSSNVSPARSHASHSVHSVELDEQFFSARSSVVSLLSSSAASPDVDFELATFDHRFPSPAPSDTTLHPGYPRRQPSLSRLVGIITRGREAAKLQRRASPYATSSPQSDAASSSLAESPYPETPSPTSTIKTYTRFRNVEPVSRFDPTSRSRRHESAGSVHTLLNHPSIPLGVAFADLPNYNAPSINNTDSQHVLAPKKAAAPLRRWNKRVTRRPLRNFNCSNNPDRNSVTRGGRRYFAQLNRGYEVRKQKAFRRDNGEINVIVDDAAVTLQSSNASLPASRTEDARLSPPRSGKFGRGSQSSLVSRASEFTEQLAEDGTKLYSEERTSPRAERGVEQEREADRVNRSASHPFGDCGMREDLFGRCRFSRAAHKCRKRMGKWSKRREVRKSFDKEDVESMGTEEDDGKVAESDGNIHGKGVLGTLSKCWERARSSKVKMASVGLR